MHSTTTHLNSNLWFIINNTKTLGHTESLQTEALRAQLQLWSHARSSCVGRQTVQRTCHLLLHCQYPPTFTTAPPATPMALHHVLHSLSLTLEQRGVGPEIRARLGGLLPQEWTALFWEQHSALDPVLPSLHQKQLSATHGIHGC